MSHRENDIICKIIGLTPTGADLQKDEEKTLTSIDRNIDWKALYFILLLKLFTLYHLHVCFLWN